MSPKIRFADGSARSFPSTAPLHAVIRQRYLHTVVACRYCGSQAHEMSGGHNTRIAPFAQLYGQVGARRQPQHNKDDVALRAGSQVYHVTYAKSKGNMRFAYTPDAASIAWWKT
jgi:hypothetical protein